ncbi:MAG: sigma-70 family RNA polymerase sigma factor, partial [Planctomycetaceae bacterium]|nr:sigma-70 family RNA polymerase sigma factor [Planctomycetaceae bacterium]
DLRDAKRTIRWPDESAKKFEKVLLDDGTSPSEAVDRILRQEQIRRVLEQLAPDDQDILWMRHFDGLAYEEIGAVLKITPNAATVRYFRAMKRLKRIWKTLYGGHDES